jgi:hypothetical protein
LSKPIGTHHMRETSDGRSRTTGYRCT